MRIQAVGIALAGLAAAGVAVAAGVSAAAPHRAHVVASDSCLVDGGTDGTVTVLGLPKLWLNAHVRHSKKGFSLHAKDRLRTADKGKIHFCLTAGETSCDVDPGSRLRVLPTEDVLLTMRAGDATCSMSSGDTKDVKAGGSDLQLGDPVFAVSVAKSRTVVKVYLGVVQVRDLKGLGAPVVLAAGTQTVVPRGAAAAPPKPITIASTQKAALVKLAAAMPRSGLTRPDPDGSTALATIFSRGFLSVELGTTSTAVRTFAQTLLGSLARAWGVSLKLTTATASEAAQGLARGTVDAFVTAQPKDVTSEGLRLKLGDAAGVAAVPFFASVRDLFQLATRADAGLAAALRRYLGASVLQSRIYAAAFLKAFRQPPRYDRLGDLAFPTAAHANGVNTIVHQGFAAVVNGQLGPGLKITGRGSATCKLPSSASARTDAWTCVDGTQKTWDPCFSGIQNIVICPADPPVTEQPVHVVALALTAPLPAIVRPRVDPTTGPARRIVTTDNEICEPSSGAKPSFGAQPINYLCRDADGTKVASLAGQPYRAGAPWTVLTLPLDWQTNPPAVADTTGVTGIWFW